MVEITLTNGGVAIVDDAAARSAEGTFRRAHMVFAVHDLVLDPVLPAGCKICPVTG
jgi:hypothetical protein